MLYLGIDQHARQITISLRDESGDVIQARQVSTQPEKIIAFFDDLTRRCASNNEAFVAVLEVCGFNDWLIEILRNYRCERVILMQPDEQKKRKTDRRDAASLSELLWVNRTRLLQGKAVRGLRQVTIPSTTDREDRRLTTLRKQAGQKRTRIILSIKHMLRRYNLLWDVPTKIFPTQRAIAWAKKLALPKLDRLELDHLLEDLERIDHRLAELQAAIVERCQRRPDAMLLTSIPGVSHFTATALASRVGDVKRFPRSHSLANYWGLTPGCRNSGENNQRLGSITKAGSSIARWLLAQMTHKVLRKDTRLRAWFKRIKRRRGSGIARVAVMRKLATLIWHMLSRGVSYEQCRQLSTG